MKIVVNRSLAIIIATLGFIASGAKGQDILAQYTIPYQVAPAGPYWVTDQFASPDGSGGMFFFNPPDGSLHRFDPSGKELWSTTFSFGSLQGSVTGLSVAADGVYLAGQVNGALPGQTNAGSFDAFVVKYDFNGNNLWTQEFGTAADDYVSAIALAPGGFYVLGDTDGTMRMFISRWDSSGTEIWTSRFNDPAVNDILEAAADTTGVYFSEMTVQGTYNVVRKFDSSGNDLWTHELDLSAIVLGLAPDNEGAYVAFLAPALSVRRLDLTGSEVWTKQIVNSIGAGPIATDGTGFYLSGVIDTALPGQCYAGRGDVFLMRFDANANPLWTREFGTAGPDSPAEISIGSSSVYLSWFGPNNSVFLTSIEKSSPPVTGSQPSILNECVLNAANYLGGGVAPGEIVTILGSNLGPADLVKFQPTGTGQIPTSVAGTQVLFNGEAAPLIYASDQQSSAIVPFDVAGQSSVSVQVEYNGVPSNAVTVPVFDSRLGVFSFGPNGTGQTAVINQDGTVNSIFNPASPGSNISIYATGAGLGNPPGTDSQITGMNPPTFQSSTYVRLDSDGSCDAPYFAAQVTYYGGAPESVPGLVQINAQLPSDAPTGNAVPLYVGLFPNSTVEQTVTIAIR